MIGIYKITNLVNNKIYIGKSVNLEKRIREEKNLYKVFGILKNSILKHGVENFKWEVIEECKRENINEREIHWISYYKSNNKNIGYNLTKGGDGGDTLSLLSEERKKEYAENMSSIKKGKPLNLTEEGRRKLRESKLGDLNPSKRENVKKKLSEMRKGKPLSEEHKRRISEAQKGKPLNLTEEGRRKLREKSAKKVLCVETGEIFISASEAARKYNGRSSDVSRVCRGERNSFRNLKWKYI